MFLARRFSRVSLSLKVLLLPDPEREELYVCVGKDETKAVSLLLQEPVGYLQSP